MKKEILVISNLTTKKHEEVLLQNVHFQIYEKEIIGLIAREDKGAKELIEFILMQNMTESCLIESKSHLLDALSIAENIFVVRNRFRKYFIKQSVLEDQLHRYCMENDIILPIDKRISELTEYERCVVELIKADILGKNLIILANPSNYISQLQLPKFHDLLRKFKKKGMSFLYIGYHHQEVFTIADRTALLANGYIKKIFQKYEMTDESIAPYINPILEGSVRGKMKKERFVGNGEQSTFFSIKNPSNMEIQLSDFTLNIERGECIALIDMDNVLKDKILKDLLTGDLLDAPKCSFAKTHRYLVIPEDFTKQFLFQDLSYFENLIFLLDRKLGKSILPKRIKESIRSHYRQKVGDVIDEKDIGGLNTIDLQRLVYYKALLFKPDLLICLQPYAGGDVHCRMEVSGLIKELQEAKIAVFIVSSNFADIMDVADKVMVMENKKIRNIKM